MPEADEALEHRLAFERLLANLSARFANVTAGTFAAEIEAAQRKLMTHLEFDRCTFIEFSAGDASVTTLSPVAASGIEPHSTGPYILAGATCQRIVCW